MPILGTALWPVGGQDDWCLGMGIGKKRALRHLCASSAPHPPATKPAIQPSIISAVGRGGGRTPYSSERLPSASVETGQTPPATRAVYQDAPLGALRQVLGSQPGLDPLLRMRIAWGVAQAMAHVEMNQDHFPFVHLSPESVLVCTVTFPFSVLVGRVLLVCTITAKERQPCIGDMALQSARAKSRLALASQYVAETVHVLPLFRSMGGITRTCQWRTALSATRGRSA
jgi:hypothetical protein